jgi:phosphate-selective porin OprO and OprP
MSLKTDRLRATLLAGAASAALLAGPVSAQDAPKHHHHPADGISARLDRMERIIEDQEAQIKSLKAQVGQTAVVVPAPQPQVTATQFAALQNQVQEQTVALKNGGGATVTLGKNGKPLISSADGRYTFSPRVLVQGDYASFSKDTVAGMPIKNSGENFRRGWIGFQGKFAGDFGYKFIYDFGGTNGDETYQAYTNTKGALTSTGAGTGPHIQSALVTYKGFLDPFTFQIGAGAPPANLGDSTAADDLIFNERASPSQISRSLGGDDGRDGVGFFGNGNWWFASAFLTGDTAGKGALIAPSNSQSAFVGRVAIFPFNDPATNFSVHLGGNYTDVFNPQQSTSSSSVTTTGITFSDRPELRVDNFTLLNTGAINATSAYAAGIEGAVSWGPFLLQGENFWYGASRKAPATGVTDPSFSGWYLDASWVLTGEYHKYNPATASYTRPSPTDGFDPSAGDWGAWEIAGRYSDTDLDYHLTSATAADRVFGGQQKIWTAALNFYPNDILKFGLDWQNITADNVGKLANDTKYNVISLRTQVSF